MLSQVKGRGRGDAGLVGGDDSGNLTCVVFALYSYKVIMTFWRITQSYPHLECLVHFMQHDDMIIPPVREITEVIVLQAPRRVDRGKGEKLHTVK